MRRAQVDIVGPKGARELLKNIIDFVGKSAGGSEKAHLVWRGVVDRLAHRIERVIPARAPESALSFAADHRMGQAAERAELFWRHFSQAGRVAQRRDI